MNALHHDRQLEILDADDCVRALASSEVARVGIVADGGPLVFPVNIAVGRTSAGDLVVLLRTRTGSPFDHDGDAACIEVDGIDLPSRTGWSVLVRGRLEVLSQDEGVQPIVGVEPRPWVDLQRSHLLALVPFAISGRRLVASESEWGFHPLGYL